MKTRVRALLAYSLFILCLFALPHNPAQAQISFDGGGANGGAVVVGASNSTCTASIDGGLRFSSASGGRIELCDGTTWNPMVEQIPGTSGPTASSGSGYFVLTHTTWNGDLGGLAGANSKCLTELATTYTSWRGYAAANANGQLVADKVKAFLCDEWSCNNLMPLTTYYFAYANSGTPGGSYFTTDSNGYGPNDSYSWGAANNFSGSYNYWTNRGASSSTKWDEVGGYNTYDSCNSWSNSSSGEWGIAAYSGTNENRFYGIAPRCNVTMHLICFVNP